MLHALEIGGLSLKNNVFLAPMAGYTNYPFRKMCEEMGAGLTFTEMVSAKGLHYQNEETRLLLYHGETRPLVPSAHPERSEGSHKPTDFVQGDPSVATLPQDERKTRPLAAQLFGADPDIMREACESEALKDFDLIDINMGCPMPKIVKNGEGSALMENPALAEKVIAACVGSGKRISVKFRVGIDENHKMCADFAKLCEGAGACMIAVHGRTRDKIYAGPPDYAEIAAAKKAVKIPVIANGGVWNDRDMKKMLERTGADGVMVARAALYRPQVFAELTGREEPPIKQFFLNQLRETKKIYGERFACVYMRKMAAFYLKGTRCASEAKRRFFAAQSTEEICALAEELM